MKKRLGQRLIMMAVFAGVLSMATALLEANAATNHTFGNNPERFWTLIEGDEFICLETRFDLAPLKNRVRGLWLERGIKYIITLYVEEQLGNPVPPGWVPIWAQLAYHEQPTGDPVLRKAMGTGAITFQILPAYSGNYEFTGGSPTGCYATLGVAVRDEDSDVRQPFR